MSQTPKKLGSAKTARVLGDKTFAAITAVEGLKLSSSAKKRLSTMADKKLSPAQKRAEVLRAYSSKGR